MLDTASGTTFNHSPREYVYHKLRQDILHLRLKPGRKISEKEMSETFRVSRTPVREAFVRLAQEGLLNIYPQRGTFVAKIDLNHVEEARFVRENLEKAVLAEAGCGISPQALQALRTNLAAQTICRDAGDYQQMLDLDNEYHRIIYYACDKQRTWELVQGFAVHFYRLRVLRLAHDVHWDTILSQHKDIYEALAAKDGPKAVAIAEDHLRLVTFEKNSLLDQYPEYFV